MKAKNQNRTCPDVLSNECIVWQGGDVPVLGICNGDELSVTEKTLADKIVELFDNINMSEVDMNCLISTCQQKCKDTSLKAVIQVLYDNQCCLHDLITGIGQEPVVVTVKLNLRCLKVFDDFGNEIPQDLNQSLQSIINQVCSTVTDVNAVKASIISIQNQLDILQTTPTTPPEPTVTTCLTPGLRPVSQTIPIVAQALCNFQTAVGPSTDMSIAISQQCQKLNTTFAGVDGWLTAVQNFAQSVNNLWILACNLNTRVTSIETNCCKASCDAVKVGFAVQVDSTGTGVFLKFTSGAGSDIPATFKDAGSTVTFTDKNNNFVTYPLVIVMGATLGDFDLSGLDLSDPFVISVNAILAADGLTCEKCVTRLYQISNTSCPVCKVTAAGTTGSITIIYTTPGSTVIQQLVLQNGQVGYIPNNAVVIASSTNGDVTASSDCINLNAPPPVCYVFAWEHSTPNNDTLGDAFFSQVIIGNLTYDIHSPYRVLVSPPPLPVFAGQALFNAFASSTIPDPLMHPTCVIEDSQDNTKVSFSVPQSLGAPMLKINNPTSEGDTKYMYLIGQISTNTDTDCGCNNTGGGGGQGA